VPPWLQRAIHSFEADVKAEQTRVTRAEKPRKRNGEEAGERRRSRARR
jgi:hypothetical protein